MNMADSNASMSFVMPSTYKLEDLPAPNSEAVQLKKQNPLVLAVLEFGGYASSEKIQKHADNLREILTKNNIQTKGALLYMGYNAPWDVVNRRNEVAFEVLE